MGQMKGLSRLTMIARVTGIEMTPGSTKRHSLAGGSIGPWRTQALFMYVEAMTSRRQAANGNGNVHPSR